MDNQFLINEIYSQAAKKNCITIKSKVYLIDDTRISDKNDLIDFEPKKTEVIDIFWLRLIFAESFVGLAFKEKNC